jgi:hypothetical protein
LGDFKFGNCKTEEIRNPVRLKDIQLQVPLALTAA